MNPPHASDHDGLNRQLIDALVQGDTETARVLVNAGADPNTRYEPTFDPSTEPLRIQQINSAPPPERDSFTALMIACGAILHLKQEGGFHRISCDERLPLLQTMLAHDANVHAITTYNRAALQFAVGVQGCHAVELLIQHGADVNAQDIWGHTSLMVAIWSETTNMTRLLLSHGANPNVQNILGETVLHLAVYSRNAKSVIPELLAHGAAPNLRAKNGDTPLHLAQKKKHSDLVALLNSGERR
jgi:ankyrin repeat protein